MVLDSAISAIRMRISQVEKMQQLSPEDMGMSMLKGQMAFIVLQGGLMYWASALFNGFAK